MVAYQAETALVNIVREKLSRKDDARSSICDLCVSNADILSDIDTGLLTIQVHSMANPRVTRILTASPHYSFFTSPPEKSNLPTSIGC